MTNNRLQDAIDGLYRYVERTTQNDVLVSSTDRKAPQTPAQPLSPQGLLMRHISTVDGGSTITQLLRDLKGMGATVDDLIQVYVDGNTLQPKNRLGPIVGKPTPNLAAVLVRSVQITPAARDIDALTLFASSIPTLEISRCVPYLTIDVTTGRGPTSASGRLQGMSLLRFLDGAATVKETTADGQMARALYAMTDGSQGNADTTTSGMELFTSPQMLVNPDQAVDALRATQALDKFRPLMSIDKLSVELTPQVGFFAYRSADLDITLHDRSRLSEVADFVKPDLYGKTELLIEYGWSHPDVSGNNAYGTLLNSMRAREKYGIVNSSFSFTRTGEVKIKLKLFTKGATDIRVVRIGDDPQVKGTIDRIRELQKKIHDIRLSLSQGNKSPFKEVRGEQELFAAAEDIQSTLTLSPEAAKELRTFVRKGGGSQSYKDLQDYVGKLFGRDGRSGLAKTFGDQVKDQISSRIRLLKSSNATSDPFLSSGRRALEDRDGISKGVELPSIPPKGFVSFARLMMVFVGLPLISQQDKYADVQLFFYPFNANAARVRQLNVGEFPINVEEFEKSIISLVQTRRGAQIPIRDFIQFIANNFIDDMGNQAYGLKRLYRSRFDKKTGTKTTEPVNSKLDETQLFDRLQARLRSLNVPDGIFKMPQVDIIIETVPVAATQEGQGFSNDFDKTILRLHFVDRVATAYESLGQIILAARDEALAKIGQLPQDDFNKHKSTYQAFLAAAIRDNIITVDRDAKNVVIPNSARVTGGVEEIKAFIRRNMPSITYGTNNTAIKDASFSTIQEPLLSTVNMLKAGDGGPLSPSGLTTGNLPLRTLPARATLTMLGCPIVHYMQQVFIDFGTNTTVDNIYGVNKLTHELAPGRFETQVDFVPLDAYGRYESLVDQVGVAIQKLATADKGGS